MERLRISLISAELEGLIEHTGFAHIAWELAVSLANVMGRTRTHLILPDFLGARRLRRRLNALLGPVPAPYGCLLWQGSYRDLTVCFIDSGEALRRTVPLGTRLVWDGELSNQGTFLRSDMALAMLRFNACVAHLVTASDSPWKSDVVHCLSWEAGLVPQLTRSHGCQGAPGVLFTVDLVNWQGLVTGALVRVASVRETLRSLGLTSTNFMASGIRHAHLVHILSRQWLRDLTETRRGHGLQAVLMERKDSTLVVGTGITATARNWRSVLPKSSRAHPNQDCDLVSAKTWAKAQLKRRLRLSTPAGPLIAVGNRVSADDQKNYSACIDVLPRVLANNPNLQIVMRLYPLPETLPEPAAETWERLEQLSTKFSEQVRIVPLYDRRGRKSRFPWHFLLFAADVYLQPSKYEPGGMSALLALCYGCIIVGTRKGYLADCGIDQRDAGANGNGWYYDDPGDFISLETALQLAASTYSTDQTLWRRMVRNAPRTAPKWTQTRNEFIRIYRATADLARTHQEVPSMDRSRR